MCATIGARLSPSLLVQVPGSSLAWLRNRLARCCSFAAGFGFSVGPIQINDHADMRAVLEDNVEDQVCPIWIGQRRGDSGACGLLYPQAAARGRFNHCPEVCIGHVVVCALLARMGFKPSVSTGIVSIGRMVAPIDYVKRVRVCDLLSRLGLWRLLPHDGCRWSFYRRGHGVVWSDVPLLNQVIFYVVNDMGARPPAHCFSTKIAVYLAGVAPDCNGLGTNRDNGTSCRQHSYPYVLHDISVISTNAVRTAYLRRYLVATARQGMRFRPWRVRRGSRCKMDVNKSRVDVF